MAHQQPQNIVIIGGGIAGLSTAYYLTHHPTLKLHPDAKVTVVEGTGVASAASGYSGGFLAKDWHGSATASLSAVSYDLHAQLAKDHGGDKWGYRAVDTLSVEIDATSKSKKPSPLNWLPAGLVHSSRTLGTTKTNAQVHPGQFTRWLSEQLLTQPNTNLILGRARSLKLEDGKVSGVTLTSPKLPAKTGNGVNGSNGVHNDDRLENPRSHEVVDGEKEISCDAVVIAAGPWTGKLALELLGENIGGRLGVEGHRAHSIILKTKEDLSAHCLFTSMTLGDGSAGEPEVYTRPDGTTYVCGAGDNEPLPETAADVTPSKSAIAKLYKQAHELSPVFDVDNGAASRVAEQACFLPIADRGRPLIGKVRGVDGVYVGSGLSCWGITQGPGTGICLAELIMQGKATSADISKLAP